MLLKEEIANRIPSLEHELSEVRSELA